MKHNVNSRRKNAYNFQYFYFYSIHIIYIIHNTNSKHNIQNQEIIFNKVSHERWDSLSKENIMSAILCKIPRKDVIDKTNCS